MSLDIFKEVKYVGSLKTCLLIVMCVVILGGCGSGSDKPDKDAPAKGFIKILFEIWEPDIEEENGEDPISPSYQTVIWLEDESGKYVKSLLVSEWLSYGGYKRPGVCTTWVDKVADEFANLTEEEFDAITSPTPYFGENELIVDCAKKGLQPGVYYYCVETHVTGEYNILYRGRIEIGPEETESIAEVTYIPSKHPEAGEILSEVKAKYYHSK